HRPATGGGHAVSRNRGPVPAARLHRRLLAAGRDVRRGAADPAAHAPDPSRAEVHVHRGLRGGPPRPRRGRRGVTTERSPTMPRAFQEKDVALSNGLTLHYYEWPGTGPALVLLHPSSGYGRMWEWTVDALGEGLHVYA